VHPPFAKLLVAIGIATFGYNAWAFRLASAIAGILLAPTFYALARRVLSRERAALLATVVLLTDGVYLVQSRVAMTNIFAVLFQTAAALALWPARDADRLRWRDAVALGLTLGMAAATRWTSAGTWVLLLLFLAAGRRRRLMQARELAWAALAFAVLPACVYVATYIPWMEQGHTLMDVLGAQRAIWRYHAHLSATHPYTSAWYTWPWLVRPAWYFVDRTPHAVRGIVALGNPLVWWASVPVTIWGLWAGFRRDGRQLLFGAVGFCALYLPWAVGPRSVNFAHYLFEAIPFACLGLGALLDRFWDGDQALLARAYVVLAILLFVVFYPLWTAVPLPPWMLGGGSLYSVVS
jgi:dolichyl-phosphate-mannose-protein mannosyltransferase